MSCRTGTMRDGGTFNFFSIPNKSHFFCFRYVDPYHLLGNKSWSTSQTLLKLLVGNCWFERSHHHAKRYFFLIGLLNHKERGNCLNRAYYWSHFLCLSLILCFSQYFLLILGKSHHCKNKRSGLRFENFCS